MMENLDVNKPLQITPLMNITCMNVFNMAKEIAHTKAYGMYPNFTNENVSSLSSQVLKHIHPLYAPGHHHHLVKKSSTYSSPFTNTLHEWSKKYCTSTSFNKLGGGDIFVTNKAEK